jgi:hypothetical protein
MFAAAGGVFLIHRITVSSMRGYAKPKRKYSPFAKAAACMIRFF